MIQLVKNRSETSYGMKLEKFYSVFSENKRQMAEIMGISRQVFAYKLKTIFQKMRERYRKEFFCIAAGYVILNAANAGEKPAGK